MVEVDWEAGTAPHRNLFGMSDAHVGDNYDGKGAIDRFLGCWDGSTLLLRSSKIDFGVCWVEGWFKGFGVGELMGVFRLRGMRVEDVLDVENVNNGIP